MAHEVHQVGESSRSWMVKAGSSPIACAYMRSSRAPTAWKVPDQRMGLRAPPAGSPSAAGDDALDPALHLGRRAAREGEQQDAAGVGAVHDQVRDPVGERVGLARAGAGDHQQRAGNVRAPAGDAVLDGAALLRIEAFESSARPTSPGARDRGSMSCPDHDSFATAKGACAKQKKTRRQLDLDQAGQAPPRPTIAIAPARPNQRGLPEGGAPDWEALMREFFAALAISALIIGVMLGVG